MAPDGLMEERREQGALYHDIVSGSPDRQYRGVAPYETNDWKTGSRSGNARAVQVQPGEMSGIGAVSDEAR